MKTISIIGYLVGGVMFFSLSLIFLLGLHEKLRDIIGTQYFYSASVSNADKQFIGNYEGLVTIHGKVDIVSLRKYLLERYLSVGGKKEATGIFINSLSQIK